MMETSYYVALSWVANMKAWSMLKTWKVLWELWKSQKSWTTKIFVIILCYAFHLLYHCNIVCVCLYIYIYIYIQKLTNEITSFLQIFSNYIFMILEPGSWFKAMGASCWWRDYWGCNNTTLKCSAWVARMMVVECHKRLKLFSLDIN